MDGRIIDVLASYAPIYDLEGEWEGGVAVYKDITERKIYEKQLKQLALKDFLTGLPNRAFFYQKLNEEIAAAQETQKSFALLSLDLDKFKISGAWHLRIEGVGHQMFFWNIFIYLTNYDKNKR
ncbi:diguanylate cyclase domain-containing protein [Neobacillus muris]|uniref:diguanylate cyclase domain-containing protein n=1 Tax=Neobacillus muris TaxID=2941334 RepID=UPI00203C07FF|nr:diguanylate cyclase [Neobacillus muris]